MIGYICNAPHASLHMWEKPALILSQDILNVLDIENTTSHSLHMLYSSSKISVNFGPLQDTVTLLQRIKKFWCFADYDIKKVYTWKHWNSSILLFNYQNKLIPELHPEDRNPLSGFNYDLHLQHVPKWRATNLLRTTCLPSSASVQC